MPTVTFSRLEAKKLLALDSVAALDALIEAHVLRPTCYDARGLALFELPAIRRAAEDVFGSTDPLQQLKRKYAHEPGARKATNVAGLLDAIVKDTIHRRAATTGPSWSRRSAPTCC
jgi:hypothetical protein